MTKVDAQCTVYIMDDSNGSWDADTRWSRDVDREPTISIPRTRTPRKQLDARGSVKISYYPPCETSAHEQAKADEARWSAFKWNGLMPSYNTEGPPAVLELRTCPLCKSTCAREVEAVTEEALALLRREGLL